jgi:hypothetical protein
MKHVKKDLEEAGHGRFQLFLGKRTTKKPELRELIIQLTLKMNSLQL